MLLVVAILALAPIVVYSMFVSALDLATAPGSLALHYRNIYAARGGYSNGGALCGAFYVFANYGFSGTVWHLGAALSL